MLEWSFKHYTNCRYYLDERETYDYIFWYCFSFLKYIARKTFFAIKLVHVLDFKRRTYCFCGECF